jgi:hypothetical protein
MASLLGPMCLSFHDRRMGGLPEQHRDIRCAQDLLGDTALQEPRYAASTMGRHGNKIGAPLHRSLSNRRRRGSLEDDPLDLEPFTGQPSGDSLQVVSGCNTLGIRCPHRGW